MKLPRAVTLTLASLVPLYALLLAVLHFAVPGWLIEKAQHTLGEHGRKLQVSALEINPFSFEIEARGVKLSDRDGTPLLALQRLYLDAEPSALLLGRWRMDALQLEHPELHLQRNPSGAWNWATLVQELSGPPKPAEEYPEQNVPDLRIEQLQISQARIAIDDALPQPAQQHRLNNLNLKMRALATRPSDGGYRLDAELDNGSKLAWHGQLELAPLRSHGSLQLDNLQLASLWPYLQAPLRLDAPRGLLSAHSSYRLDLSQATPQLQLDQLGAKLAQLQINAPGNTSQFQLKTLQLAPSRFDLQQRRLQLGKLSLNEASLSAQRDAAGQLDWLKAMVAQTASAPAAAPSKETPFNIQLAGIELHNWQLQLNDLSMAAAQQLRATLAQARLDIKLGQQGRVELPQLELQQIAAAAAQGKPYATLERATLSQLAYHFADARLEPGQLALDGFKLQLQRDRKGQIVPLAGLQPRAKPRPAKSAGKPAKSAPLPLPALTLSNGTIDWHDQQLAKPLHLTLSELNAELPAGAQRINLSGRLERAALSAQLQLAPSLRAELQLNKLALPPLAGYLALPPALQLKQGTLSAKMALQQRGNNWQINGSPQLERVLLLERGQREPLLGWQALQARNLQVDTQPLRIRIGELNWQAPQARLILDAQRQLNLSRLLAGPPGKAPSVKASSQPLPPVEIRQVRIRGGQLNFADYGMNPAFGTRMHSLQGTLLGLSTAAGRRSTVTIDGRVDQFGEVRMRGTLQPLAATDDTDLTLAFRNIPLSSVNTYSMNFAGWKINDGRLSVNLEYKIKQRQLQGNNQVVIDSIQLGEEVDQPGVTRLPLKLAIALLEDSDGRIDLALPVKGDLADPKFSYGHLVWQAFKTVITKIATAPFRALSSLLGHEGFDSINFVPGEAKLTPAEREKIQALATLLGKRPKLSLQLGGSFDPERDTRELARAEVDQAILSAAGFKLSAEDPLPLPDSADPAIRSALRSVYGQQLGRIRLLGKLMNGQSDEQRYPALRDELIAAQKIDARRLGELARARAKHAMTLLLANNPQLAARVRETDPRQVRGAADGIALVLDLERSSTP